MRFLSALALAIAAFAAQAAGPKTGRLVGHVDVGPITPVEHPGVKPIVPPEWYRRYTVLVTQRGPHNGRMKSMMIRIVARLRLNDHGDFSTNLQPGEYDLKVEPEHGAASSQSKTVQIQAGRTTRVALSVDTGIR